MSNRLPNDLIDHLKGDPQFDYEAFIAVHDHEQKTASIRINPAKNFDVSALDVDKAIPWCNGGYYLKERPKFTLDPLYHAGCYYSQEASSMFLDLAIRALGLTEQPIKALDLCAAPGGKSTLIQGALSSDSMLVANEIIKNRVLVLNDNLVRWGGHNVVVSNNDPSAFSRLPGYFDLMVVDAPCSGSGMFHKDHDAIKEWSLANVKLCSERQKRILADSLVSLKTGGYLFYSTCSYSKEENEGIVDWIIDEFDFENVPLAVADSWGIHLTQTDKHQATGYRFYPHQVEGEGFFCAVLKKKALQQGFSMKKLKTEKSGIPQNLPQQWVNMEENFAFLHHDHIHVFPKAYETDLVALQKVLYLKNAGTTIGKLVGKEIIPSHDLALSNLIQPNIPAIDLSLADSLCFLRKDNLGTEINPEGLKGWVLMRYKGVNLGWIKAISNRINNYYPKELRIQHL